MRHALACGQRKASREKLTGSVVRPGQSAAAADWGKYVIRRYRAPASQLVPWLICSAVFILIGLSVLTQPSHRVGVGGVILAVLAGGVGCVGAALRLTTNVTLTPLEISYRYNFRRRAIPWASVESFRVAPAPGWGNWSCVVVDMRLRGGVRLPVVGTRRYVRRIMAELEAYRAGLAALPLTET